MELIIFDEELLFGDALAALLGSRGHAVLSYANDRVTIAAQLTVSSPDACIVSHDAVDGSNAVGVIRSLRPDLTIVTLVAEGALSVLLESLKAGADGVCLKADGIDEIEGVVLRAIATRVECSGRGPAWSRAALASARRNGADRQGTALTIKERAVLDRLVAGATTSRIAEDLGVGEATIRTHLQHLFGKFGVHSRIALVAQAIRTNTVQLDAEHDLAIAG
jgi:two-component system nitrate/nitrite response regulator NarL